MKPWRADATATRPADTAILLRLTASSGQLQLWVRGLPGKTIREMDAMQPSACASAVRGRSRSTVCFLPAAWPVCEKAWPARHDYKSGNVCGLGIVVWVSGLRWAAACWRPGRGLVTVVVRYVCGWHALRAL